MYQDKLANFKNQLEQLKNSTHPEYIRRVRKLELQYNERLRVNAIFREFSIECVEREFITEKKAAVKEYDEKRADLKENLISDFEEKRKSIEAERYNMELTGDPTETKPTVTRKLRRRPNDPIPMTAEKRRKPTVGQLVYQLDEKEIDNDLKLISRGKTQTPVRPPSVGSNGLSPLVPNLPIASSLPPTESYSMVETKIEDGKLLYERRWFHRGQPVYVEGKDLAKFPATILSIANDGVSLNKIFAKWIQFNSSNVTSIFRFGWRNSTTATRNALKSKPAIYRAERSPSNGELIKFLLDFLYIYFLRIYLHSFN